ncbi:MAG: hemolysin family protein [Deltaproteobacteria bacterium]|nr:hemolysin family protein [Deltaproteobacteria bacterium]MCL5791776.1 hemolysin family protein [Deltaproteobacteria bacterium]
MDVSSSFILRLLLIGFFILLNALFAASEIAIIIVKAKGIKKEKNKGKIQDSLQFLVNDTKRLFSTIQIMVTIVGFLSSAVASEWYASPLADYFFLHIGFLNITQWHIVTIIFVTIIISYLFLVLGELFPKAIAVEYADKIALIMAPVINMTSKLLSPFVEFLTLSVNMIGRIFGLKLKGKSSIITQDEIRAIIDTGAKEGVVEPDAKQMLYSILEFSDTMVKEIMIPRVDVTAIEKDTPLDDSLNRMIESGYSRMPIYEKDMDHVLGIVHIKDLLDAKNKGKTLLQILRIASFIPDTMRLDDAIKEFRKRDIQMAVVTDEYGGISGIVTMEDILEELVGEIRDEYDLMEEEPIQHILDGIISLGNVKIADINEAIGVGIDDTKISTIGGFVTSMLGHYPSVGEVYEDEQLRITVIKVKGRIPEKLKVTKKLVEESNMDAF